MVNVKLAVRTLFKAPVITAVAVVSLALGIGANAAIFSLFDQLLLRPLPVPNAERLVDLSSPGPKPGSQSCGQAGECDEVFSYPMFRDLEASDAARRVFSGIAAHVLFGANVAYQRQTLNGEGVMVSGSYFPVLGLRPALGRLFTPEDDKTIGGHYVAVLSYGYWASKLGADPSVLNQQIVVNGQSLTVIGVAPRGFEGTTIGALPMVFVPMTMRAVMRPGFTGFTNRRSYWAYLFARLAPGVSMAQAATAINSAYRPIITDVEAPLQQGMSDQTMGRFKAKLVTLADGRTGQSSMHSGSKIPLIFLFSITGIVLLIACANIANLLLARAASRSMEMAVRLSLGATRRQLLGQLLTESCLLALMGGVAGLLVARWTIGLIVALLPSEVTTIVHFALSLSAVWFTGLLSLGTGLMFGLFPALHSTSPDLISTLRAGTGKHSGARSASRFRTSLVTAQIALSMALLISAGLFIKSLSKVSRVELGIKVDNLILFGLSPELNGYNGARSAVFLERVTEELRALPGVSGVTSGMVPLLAGDNWGNVVSVEGFKKGPDTDANARFNAIGPDYFKTVGVPILSGREFTMADGNGSPKVAVVNEAFAKKFGLGRDAVGKRIATGDGPLDIEIVGLVKDAKYSSVKQEIPPQFFLPWRQDSTVGSLAFYARTSGSMDLLLRSVPGVIARLDPNLPVERLKSMPQEARESVFLDRMIGTLSAAFAALATLLAAVGLYGVLAFSVAQRTREIGVRIALGADIWRVRGLVLRQVGLMTLVGGTIGIAAALGLARVARSLLYELKGHDPMVLSLAALLLTAVALGSGYIPAVRASRIDPMQALRYE